MKLIRFGAFAIIAAAAVMAAYVVSSLTVTARTRTSPEVVGMHFAPYEAQKVVYHVTEGEGLFERRFKNILHVARNHVDAVMPGELDLRIILQGGAIDMLKNARSDAGLAHTIDRLRKDGVSFVICRNTLMLKGVDPTALYGVKREDIVASTVAETAKLVRDGYVYMKF